MGPNAAQLELGSSFHRLHPVFNVSLLTPYIHPSVGGRPDSTAPTSPQPTIPIHNWHHVAGILDYRTRGRTHSEYLLRWLHGTPSDDTWVPLTDISTALDPFLFQFHARYPKFSIPLSLKNNSHRVQTGRLAATP